MHPKTSALCALLVGALSAATYAEPPLATTRIAAGLARPVWVGSPPGDDRLFVVEQKTGLIRIIDNGVVLPTPFLNVLSKVNITGNERGLLGMAFHPDYASNGFFYIDYTRSPDGATIVERYTVSANPNVADPTSAVVMLGPIAQPASNHNAGGIAFGPDGYLYVPTGDGGGAGDTNCNSQKTNVLLGKVLRIDVDAGGAAPASNPFVGNPAYDARIWQVGTRNPWRWSFDRANGDLYIADVGQNSREEVNWVPGSSTGGENYGWKVMEGFNCFSTSNCPAGTPPCNSPVYRLPLLDYPTNQGSNCAVTGGYVYRGSAIPGMQGTYFYGDYCAGTIFSFRVINGAVVDHQNRTADLAPITPGQSIDLIPSFGETAAGEILICDQTGGEIFQIIPEKPAIFDDLGFGKVGGSGLVPRLGMWGSLVSGDTADLTLWDAPPVTPAVLFVSFNANPVNTLGGTLVPAVGQSFTVALFTNGNGDINLVAPGGGGPIDVYMQYVLADSLASHGAGFSNAIKVTFGP